MATPHANTTQDAPRDSYNKLSVAGFLADSLVTATWSHPWPPAVAAAVATAAAGAACGAAASFVRGQHVCQHNFHGDATCQHDTGCAEGQLQLLSLTDQNHN